MKKLFIILCISMGALTACKKDSKSVENKLSEAQENDLFTLTGDFIYYADAAVLQTSNEIYGVALDEKMHELDKAVKPYKKDVTDMIKVTIKAKKIKKPASEEGWPYRLEIKEILKVEKPDTIKQDVIKLGN
ncbi:MAG: hypothetical protein HKO81_01980 [Flavobacteriaceae bacterium]|nr:hypothetical protein [Flavobacteriaceae bacterium]